MARTQTEQIKNHLQAGETITPLEALHRFGCLHLGARIHELKSDGMTIYSRKVERSGKHVAEYSAKPFKN